MYVLRLPLIGLESIDVLGQLRLQHTAVLLARRDADRRLVFDVVPERATSPATILALALGGEVGALKRTRSFSARTPSVPEGPFRTFAGVTRCGGDAFAVAAEFQSEWPDTLGLFGETSCRHHTAGLLAALLREDAGETWRRFGLGRYAPGIGFPK
ncbi:MAG: hypothetical protein VXZ39_07090 [Planctomycetota bacterium]|nr:hypothetical protein [Planctomycetota bacterium]